MYSADGQKIVSTASEVNQEDDQLSTHPFQEAIWAGNTLYRSWVLTHEVSHRDKIVGILCISCDLYPGEVLNDILNK